VIFFKNGEVLKNDVIGEITLDCKLSGMPTCKFGLNDKLLLKRDNNNLSMIHDLKFHKCVKLNKFN
jgi:AP-2 complex subunit mu-1